MLGYIKFRIDNVTWDFCSSWRNGINLFILIDNKNKRYSYDFVVNAGGYGQHPDFGKLGNKLFKSHFIGLVNLIKILSCKVLQPFPSRAVFKISPASSAQKYESSHKDV